MKHKRHFLVITAFAAALLTTAAPTAEASSWFGLHIGGSHFGLSFGVGSWDVYGPGWSATSAWDVSYEPMLASYGTWIWVDGLGRVWQPYVANDWRPYTHGRWTYTNIGWTWVSYEPWGYFPHHFGSWARTYSGWVWVPGYTYHSANVVWVGSGGHIGWYACPPRGWSHYHRSFHHGYRHGYRDGHNDGYWEGRRDGYWEGWRDARYANYVDWRHMPSDNAARYAVPRDVRHSKVHRLKAAPSRAEVSRRAGVHVPRHEMSSRTVNISGQPSTVRRVEGVRPSIERNAKPTVDRALRRDVADKFQREHDREVQRLRSQPARATTRNERARSSSRVESNTDSLRLRSQPSRISPPSRTRSTETQRPKASSRSTTKSRSSSPQKLSAQPSTSRSRSQQLRTPSSRSSTQQRLRTPQQRSQQSTSSRPPTAPRTLKQRQKPKSQHEVGRRSSRSTTRSNAAKPKASRSQTRLKATEKKKSSSSSARKRQATSKQSSSRSTADQRPNTRRNR
jgi:hypothetical protein